MTGVALPTPHTWWLEGPAIGLLGHYIIVHITTHHSQISYGGFSSSTTAEFFISARALTLRGGGKVEHMHTRILYIHFKTYDCLLKQKMKKMKETKINK